MATNKRSFWEKIEAPARVGIANVTREFIEMSPAGVLLALFEGVRIIEERELPTRDIRQYIVVSDSFDEIDENSIVPEYKAIMEKTQDGAVKRLRWERWERFPGEVPPWKTMNDKRKLHGFPLLSDHEIEEVDMKIKKGNSARIYSGGN